MILPSLAAALAFSAVVYGHPETEEERSAQAATLRRIAAHAKRSLADCADSPAARALNERAVARRAAWADELRVKRGLQSHAARRGPKELEQYLAVSHNHTSAGHDLNDPLGGLFGSNASCVLVPETIIGPYYVEGEYLRTNITDGETGVASHVDIQFIDVNTCEAVPGLVVDLWHANATGVYSGVTAELQGGLKTNFGRGIQQTDDDGVVQFSTIFPGHYVGRTNHFHVMSTDSATMLPNGTFEHGTSSHIGQIYFDQALITEVEKTEPYMRNQQPVTDNRQDSYTGDEAAEDYDSIMKYVYLGSEVQDGLLLWQTIGIDTTANYNNKVEVASKWHPGGGTDEGGRHKDKNGRPEENGRPKEENGRPKENNGRPKEENGRPKEENGRPKEKNGRPEKEEKGSSKAKST
ncbi:Intradiol ring-cleavage dioxygenase, core [Metarhizium album ARSEF 1941]|uniref:Intradiol ring-cleavage dioxygenase, core n=1 Tax=Metarhizium album (strain ARSEF 1941) TaxID=1081103 RepID=A0A0B2WXJ2_METAS|nr:Intradiol ring-cleavage dioxygenase, core [Metarhizium album ARSEF 1941]KHN98279.1 Intradiol ring-cleavage dioxygenase, core [Metarhizium album ARSEF 1941]